MVLVVLKFGEEDGRGSGRDAGWGWRETRKAKAVATPLFHLIYLIFLFQTSLFQILRYKQYYQYYAVSSTVPCHLFYTIYQIEPNKFKSPSSCMMVPWQFYMCHHLTALLRLSTETNHLLKYMRNWQALLHRNCLSVPYVYM